jgi:para-aminobenzoate synthetase component 1
VVSNSPECFLRQRGEVIVSEPIKGTRRRVAGAEAATRSALLASAKDNAELTMIVDLVRNDLGRVARPGSVAVLAGGIMDLPYVHHLVGRIGAVLRPGQGLADAARAAFPAGSITGAPKIRAMQIIAALEAGPRGAYCGSFGWIGAGHADLAVAIRTLTVADDAVRLHAGGGIVADSDGAAEWDEVRAKAAAMAAALGGAW